MSRARGLSSVGGPPSSPASVSPAPLRVDGQDRLSTIRSEGSEASDSPASLRQIVPAAALTVGADGSDAASSSTAPMPRPDSVRPAGSEGDGGGGPIEEVTPASPPSPELTPRQPHHGQPPGADDQPQPPAVPTCRVVDVECGSFTRSDEIVR